MNLDNIEEIEFYKEIREQQKEDDRPLQQRIASWFKELVFFEAMALIFIIVGIIIILLVFWVAKWESFTEEDKIDDITQYAEFIGGLVGSLWSLAGTFLFYASLGSQKEELESQKNLLVKQINEVIKQTEESRKQNHMVKEQKDEQTFFQLLRFHNEIISSIMLETTDIDFETGKNVVKTISGRRTFVDYYSIYKRFFQEASETMMMGSMDNDTLKSIVESAYGQFSEEYQSDLGHYFRNLYNILKFIDGLEEINTKFYLSLLLAQLSNFELALIFFHGLKSSNKDFKELVEKYGVLGTVPKDEMTSMVYKLWDEKAFGDGGFGSGDDISDGMGFDDNDFDGGDDSGGFGGFPSSGAGSGANSSDYDAFDDDSWSIDDLNPKPSDSSSSEGLSIADKLKNLKSRSSTQSEDEYLKQEKDLEESSFNSLKDKLKSMKSSDDAFDSFDDFGNDDFSLAQAVDEAEKPASISLKDKLKSMKSSDDAFDSFDDFGNDDFSLAQAEDKAEKPASISLKDKLKSMKSSDDAFDSFDDFGNDDFSLGSAIDEEKVKEAGLEDLENDFDNKIADVFDDSYNDNYDKNKKSNAEDEEFTLAIPDTKALHDELSGMFGGATDDDFDPDDFDMDSLTGLQFGSDQDYGIEEETFEKQPESTPDFATLSKIIKEKKASASNDSNNEALDIDPEEAAVKSKIKDLKKRQVEDEQFESKKFLDLDNEDDFDLSKSLIDEKIPNPVGNLETHNKIELDNKQNKEIPENPKEGTAEKAESKLRSRGKGFLGGIKGKV